MCGEVAPHSMKDCPKTIAYLASGFMKMDTNGRVARSDGKYMPRAPGVPGDGGIAKIIEEELAKKKGCASSVECEPQYASVANYKYAELDQQSAVYDVMPAH